MKRSAHKSFHFFSVILPPPFFFFFCLAEWLHPSLSRAEEIVTDGTIIVTSIFPVADWCKKIASQDTCVIHLCPPITNPVIDCPNADQLAILHRARLLIRVGYNIDNPIETLFQQIKNPNAEIMVLEEEMNQLVHDFSDQPNHFSDRIPAFPWLDPIWAQDAIRIISQRLTAFFPHQADLIERNTRDYAYQLRELHMDMAESFTPFSDRSFFCSTGSFELFFRRCGLDKFVLLHFRDRHTLSADHLRNTLDLLRKRRNPVVFVEKQFPAQYKTFFMQETNCTIVELEAFGDPNRAEHHSYLDFMQLNLTYLKEGLSHGND
jgi:ABC-type Zn uptake system ZnuABC Zn-binding protein ZnuA